MNEQVLQVTGSIVRKDFRFDVDIHLPMQGMTAIFGRSGCGKTTLLRLVAGLEKSDHAKVCFGNQCWQDKGVFVPLHKRRIGLVFQEHSLFTHLSVRDNMMYGYVRTPKHLRRLELAPIAELLGISDLLDRRIDALSGGQRQRVAIGRALLSSPQLLLLDEPLSALDAITKREIMPFLEHLSQQVGVPILMVSHSAKEVERLADRVIFMKNGKVDRIETLKEALSRVDSPLFSEAGAVTVWQGTIDTRDGERHFVSGSVDLQLSRAMPLGEQRLRIIASDVSLALNPVEGISVLNQLAVHIVKLDAYGAGKYLVTLHTLDGQVLLSEVTEQAVKRLNLQLGLSAVALIKAVALVD